MTPRRPEPPVRESSSSDSCARSRSGSSPRPSSVQPGRRRPRAARRAAVVELVLEQLQEARGGPPPSAITSAGVPVGSAPTETAVARSASGTSRSESLPGRPPSGPNSSPATSTSPGYPAAPELREEPARAESDLSVSPISTCFASLVTRASASPAWRAAALAISTASPSPSRPRSRSRASTAARSSVDPRLRRIRPLGQRDQVDLPAVEPLRHDRASRPRRPSSATVARPLRPAPRPRRASPRASTSRRGPASSTSKSSEPRLTQEEERVPGRRPRAAAARRRCRRACRSRPPDADPGGQLLHERAQAGRVGSPVGHRRPVPVEHDRLEPRSRPGGRAPGSARRLALDAVMSGMPAAAFPSPGRDGVTRLRRVTAHRGHARKAEHNATSRPALIDLRASITSSQPRPDGGRRWNGDAVGERRVG